MEKALPETVHRHIPVENCYFVYKDSVEVFHHDLRDLVTPVEIAEMLVKMDGAMRWIPVAEHSQVEVGLP